MTKQEIGQYYVSLPFGERTHFLIIVENSGMDYKADRWRRVFLRWSKGLTQGKPLTKMQEERLADLIRNNHWRLEYSKMIQCIKKTVRYKNHTNK